MRGRLYFLTFWILLSPLAASAADFESDLYFGLRNNPEVTKLQEFLRDQGIYSGPVTGGFFTLTRDAVKNFQKREGIEPSLGFFGPLTRARANQLLEQSAPKSREDTISALTKQIAELQKQLQSLLDKQAAEPEKPASPSPVPTTPPVPEAVTPAKPVKLIILGSATSTFPEIEAITFKLGEFSVDNNTSQEILVLSFDAILSEEIDSTANRNRKVNFLIRDGLGGLDTLLSTTEFTFVLTAPKTGEPHKAVVNLPYNKILKAGEKKTASIWIEKMKFVRNGTLKLESTKTAISSDVVVEGKFNLVLTKEPPL